MKTVPHLIDRNFWRLIIIQCLRVTPLFSMLVLACLGCVTAPVDSTPVAPPVGVDAEWYTLDADPKSLQAIKQQKQQALSDRMAAAEAASDKTPSKGEATHEEFASDSSDKTTRGYELIQTSTVSAQRKASSGPSRRRSSSPKSETIELPEGLSTLRCLGFVEDNYGNTAALVELPPSGTRLIRVGDNVLLREYQKSRVMRVAAVSGQAIQIQDENDNQTLYLSK